MNLNLWAIIFVAVLFMLIYALGGAGEKFTELKDSKFIETNQLFVLQGSQLPEKIDKPPTDADTTNPSAPPVDGRSGSPTSLFTFAYNTCKPECCEYSPISCDRGCVCLTPSQVEFMSSRGHNNSVRKCTTPSEI